MSLFSRLTYFCIWIFFKILFTLLYRIEIKGREHIPHGAHVVCPTHRSHLDTIAVGLAYPFTRPIFYMAKEELFAVPVLGFLIRSWGAFPVKRGSHARGPLKKSIALLKEGKPVGIYPEGTRQSGAEVGLLKTGALRIARQANVPILPIYIQGTEQAFPKGSKLPKPGKIRVFLGEPLHLTGSEQPAGRRDVLREQAEKLRQAMNALKPIS